jgi:hypothetical protein
MSSYDDFRKALRDANERADREQLFRLGLLDRIEEVLNEDHDTVEGLKDAIKKTIEGY